ncbi:hypothetical protein J7K99_03005 [bacterium]|jgi:hypothetical protein|nr:hypothetical protein [bacterium]
MEKKLTTKEIERRIKLSFSGLFARGDIDDHDKKLVEKWIEFFVQLHREKEGSSHLSPDEGELKGCG